MAYRSRVGHFPDSRIMTRLVPSSHDGLERGGKREKRGGGKRRKGKGGKRSGEKREKRRNPALVHSQADARLGRERCGWASRQENQWGLSDRLGLRLNAFPVISCPLFCREMYSSRVCSHWHTDLTRPRCIYQ